MAETSPEVARINAITSNARSTWFVLLGVLSFVGVTLLSVEHIDFYGVDRATQLPLVNVEIPTPFFFYAAPPLVAAVFGYFHLYLIRLWDALSVAKAKHQGRPLGDLITPWLISDAYLFARNYIRQDRCCTHRPLEGTAMTLNFLLAWVFGLLVLFFLWWLSMPARDPLMTSLAGASFGAALLVGTASFFIAQSRARKPSDGETVYFTQTGPVIASMLVGGFVIGYVGHQRTMGPADTLAPIDLTGEDLVERPEGWLPYALARDEYRDAWCRRKGTERCDNIGDQGEAEFEENWRAQRDTQLADMRRPSWSAGGQRPKNLRRASLPGTFLVGAHLADFDIVEANLRNARLEGANLSSAKLSNADLVGASAEVANFDQADLSGANLLSVNFNGANLFNANLTGANLTNASLVETFLFASGLTATVLDGSRLLGTMNSQVNLSFSNISGTSSRGGALRHVNMVGIGWDQSTDFRNAFLDNTVTLPTGFFERMGSPCQWLTSEKWKDPISDEEFLSIWRWWLTLAEQRPPDFFAAPRDLENVPLPTKERLAELGLTDCKWDQPFGPMPTNAE